MTGKQYFSLMVKVKIVFLLCILTLLWGGLVYRLYVLQIKQSNNLSRKAEKQHERVVTVQPRRGRIYDRNHNILALSIKVKSVFCVPQEVDNVWRTAKELSSALDIDKNTLIKRITKDTKFSWIKRKCSEEEIEVISKNDFPGIYLIDEVKRYYPKGKLLSHVVGFCNIDNQGIAGLEMAYNESLKGKPGLARIYHDAKRRELVSLRQYVEKPKNGEDVVLTIDEVIQNIVEEEIDELHQKHTPLSISAIVTDISSGDILALANRPTFDLNDAYASDALSRKNISLVNIYEPGSLFKIVTAASALNENAVDINEKIHCEYGAFRIGGQTLHDSHSYDILTFEDVIAKSSNIGSAKVASRLAPEKFYDYILKFGFGKPCNIGLPGEASGKVRHYRKWSGYSVPALSMGHEILVSPLQMARLISTIANKGILVNPRLIKNQDESVENRVSVVSEKVASELTRAMIKVVSNEGTAEKAHVEGYFVAGKTGTAQKVVNGRYSHSKYVSSFFGFLPADNPKISITIMVDEPKGKTYGGDVAAPVFAKIAERAMMYLCPDSKIVWDGKGTPDKFRENTYADQKTFIRNFSEI